MKRIILCFAVWFSCAQGASFAQQNQPSVPWAAAEAIQPAALAEEINNGQAKDVLIINAGPVNDIKGAVNIGPAEDKESKHKLEALLKDVPKDKAIVIYCGCCPMEHCPNIRPAYHLLKDEGFTNFKILDIKESLSTDWIDKGYPMAEER